MCLGNEQEVRALSFSSAEGAAESILISVLSIFT